MDSMSDTCFCDLGSIPEVADVDYDHCYFNNKKKLIFITIFPFFFNGSYNDLSIYWKYINSYNFF